MWSLDLKSIDPLTTTTSIDIINGPNHVQTSLLYLNEGIILIRTLNFFLKSLLNMNWDHRQLFGRP